MKKLVEKVQFHYFIIYFNLYQAVLHFILELVSMGNTIISVEFYKIK